MTRLNMNQILALVLVLFSVGYLWMAFQIPVFPIPRPIDSDAFPKILGICLLLLSVLLFFEKQSKTENPSQQEDVEPVTESSVTGMQNPKVQVLGTAIAILAYAFLIEPLGFLLSSILLGVGLAYWFGYRQHGVNFATVGSIVLILYLLMSKVMGIYLPTGVLPF